jgi:hypothetical protein
MELEGSLSCSQKSDIEHYVEPDESTPYPHTLFLYDTF